eukprot:1374678-Ditylum_brightwellii.AAC.1
MIFADMAIVLNMPSMLLQQCLEAYVKKYHNADPSFGKLCQKHIDGHEKYFYKYKCCIDMCQHP